MAGSPKTSWDLQDFLEQIQQVKRMAAVDAMPEDVSGDELKCVEAIVCSMTPRERHTPEIIEGSRYRRIAEGSGRTIFEINRLLKDYAKMKKMVKDI